MNKIIIAVGIGMFFLAVSIGSVYDDLTMIIVEEPNFYNTDDQLYLVLDYCNDKSGFKNSIGLRYNNGTHSISNIDCKWRMLENFPDSSIICIPFTDQSRSVGEIKNKTHIFDADRCK